ncbi:PfaD family polyunsaturated fatty acid/polyketide biosynthesis protein [Pyxidicoccus fallax]|uniref:[acyl-carrier-protein] S-malonyltransferase n=1 Tax=Pyxidicoccus fallax TaxID=394095 RepID=A0A848L7Q7_9BACT|nr:PfaD family polyunsaturated fatty acid/polyketide biosynthesis protein [Pyxidicoccus fallax]NMO14587.1 PfaD family polyunsaturated fatty acid/polyketide biosynthesis protein [Pyxidicoccus fallax]NPC78926.1 PfaD family polyunsaturated fatty acid/polyketide biosynthesis protein [Pyxidicoccus fallax]
MTTRADMLAGTQDAVVFPGQGSQRPGMGADFYKQWPIARRTFEEACDAVGENLVQLCFEKDPRLHLTEFTQPCILTMEIAAYRALVEAFGLGATVFGGHSLGEYTALVAAGAIPFADAVRLVRRRGALMQQAVPQGKGAMAALLVDDIENSGALRIAKAAGAEVANHNSLAQVVISGTAESIDRAKRELAEALPALNFIPLQVSAPFHSSLMRSIEVEFRAYLESFERNFRPELAARVTSNFTGGFYEARSLTANLVQQIAGSVRWLDNMRAIGARARRIYEIGPGAPLMKFFQTLGRSVTPMTKVADAEAALREYSPPRAEPSTSRSSNGVTGPAAWNAAVPESRPVRMSITAVVPESPSPVAAPASVRTVPQPERASGTRALIDAERLGDASFRADHNVRLAYVAGAMVKGIASPELVIRMGRAGLLAFFGSGGLSLERIEEGIRRIQSALPPGAPWGVNLLHNINHPEMEDRTVDLLLRLGVRCVEASAYTVLTPAVVRYRLKGARLSGDRARPANRLMAKLSRPEVARQFVSPPPERIVRMLHEKGLISDEEARAAARLPMADDLCAEADSGGHTDKGVAFSLLPAMMHLRDEAMAEHRYPARIRVGAAGGIGTPEAAAAAFTMGADFILTGSINQCTPEAGTSDLVKDMLADADIQDFAMAPAGDMFELGARIQVFRKGVFFPARGNKLYELYQRHESLDAIDEKTREQLEKQYFKRSIAEVWAETRAYYLRADPAQVERAEKNGRHKMALVFRWYFVDTMRRAQRGDAADKVNFQVHGGPALGSFNRVVKGTPLESWRNRHVDELAWFLMRGAARVLEERWLRFSSSAVAERVA